MNSEERLFYRIWYFALAVKIVLGVVLPFLADESYYWVWSHDLHWSYFDHPPFIAWLFLLGHPFENFWQGSRIPGIILVHCSLLIWRKLLKPSLSNRQLNYFLLICLASPMIGIGSLILTPDTPLLFCWPLALWLYLQYLRKPSPWLSFGFGASLGLAFDAKYNAVLFFIFLLVHLTWDRKWSQIRAYTVPLFLIGFATFSAPVWIWNAENNWDSFLFQARHGLGASHLNLGWPISYFFEQLGILFPLFVWLAVRASREGAPKFMSVWAWGPFLFFFVTAFKGRVEANWPAVGYPALYALAAYALPTRDTSQLLYPTHIREKWAVRTVLLWLFVSTLAVTEVAFQWVPFSFAEQKIKEFYVYDPLVKVAESYQPFYASSYQMAAVLSYKMRKPIYRLRDLGRRSYYDYVPGSMPEGDTFFVALREWDQMPAWAKEWQGTKVDDINSEFRLMEYRRVGHP